MSPPPKKKLGLVGLGAFGRLAAEHLRHHFQVVASDVEDRSELSDRMGLIWGTLADAAACPIVVIAVPVQSFATVLATMREHVADGTLVIDVGSVKVAPVEAMTEHLPETVEIIGTHPMFGPQSAAEGLKGHRIVMCPVRTHREEAVREFLENDLGLDVYVCDPETHDREIAQTQALAQFVGRALAQLDRSNSPVRTPGYNLFREVAETVGNDSWELFDAIQNHNPYAADMRDELLAHLQALQRRLADDTGEDEGD